MRGGRIRFYKARVRLAFLVFFGLFSGGTPALSPHSGDVNRRGEAASANHPLAGVIQGFDVNISRGGIGEHA
jgi:hypothetical protein